MENAGGECEALLPAAGELPGELAAPVGETHARADVLHRLPRARHLIDVGDEIEVLLHREVLVEAELLRHVSDLAADARGVADDVVAEAGAAAAVGHQQAAQHADGRRLAAAVGAEKAADLALRDLEIEPVDHAPRAEALAQPVDVDDEPGHRPIRAVLLACAVCTGPPFGCTPIGWPGLIRAACSKEGRASTM